MEQWINNTEIFQSSQVWILTQHTWYSQMTHSSVFKKHNKIHVYLQEMSNCNKYYSLRAPVLWSWHVGIPCLSSDKKLDKFGCTNQRFVFQASDYVYHIYSARKRSKITSNVNQPVRNPTIGTGSNTFSALSSFCLKRLTTKITQEWFILRITCKLSLNLTRVA